MSWREMDSDDRAAVWIVFAVVLLALGVVAGLTVSSVSEDRSRTECVRLGQPASACFHRFVEGGCK